MATFAKHVSCFLFLTAFFICCHTEARESKFFSKYIHLTKTTNNNYVAVPSSNNVANKDLSIPSFASPAPSPAPVTNYISTAPTPLGSNEDGYAPAPLDGGHAPTPIESESSYYGLYGKGTSSFLSDTNTIVDNEEEKDEFSGEEFSKENSEVHNYGEPNKYVDNLNGRNSFWTSNHESYSSSNNDVYNSNVGYKSEPQGLSDTRLVDNGKYYYDVEQENYVPNGQERGNDNVGGGYSGNYDPKSRFEFDSMEAYEKQEGYPDVEDEQFIH